MESPSAVRHALHDVRRRLQRLEESLVALECALHMQGAVSDGGATMHDTSIASNTVASVSSAVRTDQLDQLDQSLVPPFPLVP